MASIALASAVAAPTGFAAPGPTPPNRLPARASHAARAEPATWLVGARLTERSRALASRYSARLLTRRGTFVVPRATTRAFVAALRAAGDYRFAERDGPTRSLQAPAGGDEFGATDWRPFAVPANLTPPPPSALPLVAVVDSAVDLSHPELAGARVVGRPTVFDRHGTAVMSVIGARLNGSGMVGMVPGAPLLSVGTRTMLSDRIRAIGLAVDQGAKIINMSWGFRLKDFALFRELAHAVQQGVVLVASAGNSGKEPPLGPSLVPVDYPAGYPHVLSVASIGRTGATSNFSTASGAVDLSALGQRVLVAVPRAFDVDGTRDGFAHADGTSFAAPTVAGAAAWLWAQRPELDAREVADVLRFSAADVGEPEWDEDTGFGRLDLSAALKEPEPESDTGEVNDDIGWTNGRLLEPRKPFLYQGIEQQRSVSGTVDLYKDPADVFPVQIPGRSRFAIVLSAGLEEDPDLAIFNARASTINGQRGLVARSSRGVGRSERVDVVNRGTGAATAYVAVRASDDAEYLNASYTLVLKRAVR